MAGSKHNYKSPPEMNEGLTYSEWKQELEIWSDFTDLEAKRQGGALFLTLTGKARQAVLAGVPRERIKAESGITSIIRCLDELYEKDKSQSGFAAYDEFTNYKRSAKISIQDYLVEFNIKYNRIKTFGMTLPDGVLAYYLLKCANLTDEQANICRATCTKLTYQDMRAQIEKVTSGTPDKDKTDSSDTLEFPVQSQFYGCEYVTDENEYTETDGPYDAYYTQQTQYQDDENETYYTQQYRPRRFSSPNNFQSYRAPRLNPPDEFGNPTRCSFCHSTYHWVEKCPHAPPRPSTYRRPGGRRGFRGRPGYIGRGQSFQDRYI